MRPPTPTMPISSLPGTTSRPSSVRTRTRSFTAKLTWRLNPDTQLIEFVCIDKDAVHYVGAPK